MNVRFFVCVSGINQRNEDFGCKKVGSIFSFVGQRTERLSLDLTRAAEKNVPRKWGCEGCVGFVVAG